MATTFPDTENQIKEATSTTKYVYFFGGGKADGTAR